MKNYFRSWLIGLIILTILLLGVMATAQKGGPIIPETCVENYPDKAGKCDFNQCKSRCAKNRKNGQGSCIDTGKGHMQCRCAYPCRRP
uniref:Knottin scorpion toxin-like domain-containing protein n=2 Tax=Brassica oleracea TaxID=3712 RepID=A0A0D3BME2_BRAOL|nr:unnamed protein product [Brassica oleracea]